MTNQNTLRDEEIAVKAYYLWESEGKPQGRDWEYWIRAKDLLSATASSAKSDKTASSSNDNSIASAAQKPARKRSASRKEAVLA